MLARLSGHCLSRCIGCLIREESWLSDGKSCKHQRDGQEGRFLHATVQSHASCSFNTSVHKLEMGLTFHDRLAKDARDILCWYLLKGYIFMERTFGHANCSLAYNELFSRGETCILLHEHCVFDRRDFLETIVLWVLTILLATNLALGVGWPFTAFLNVSRAHCIKSSSHHCKFFSCEQYGTFLPKIVCATVAFCTDL